MPDERQDTEQRVDGEQPGDATTEASTDVQPAPPPPVEEGPSESPGGQEGPAADAPPVDEGPPSPVGQRTPQAAQDAAGGDGGPADEHPEYFIGGAFVGGLVIAQILKRFGDE